MYSSGVIAELIKDIEPYVITDMRRVVDAILVSESAFFLDTGVISRIGKRDWESEGCTFFERVIDSVDPSGCVFIITELILYELKDSKNNVVQKHNRDLIINLYNAGYKVAILCEETIEETLNAYMNSSVKVFNDRFVKRINENSPFLRTVVKLIDEDPKRRGLLEDGYKIPAKSDFIADSLAWLKNNKENGDSLAEQILAMCILMFLDIPGRTRYVFYTNDKNARVNLLKIIKTSLPSEKDRVRVVMLEDKK